MSELTETADALRSALAETPAAVTFAKIPPGRESGPGDGDLPENLRDLFAATDGPRCGSIVIFSRAELDDNQYYCDDLDGGGQAWLCFGLVADNPLFLKRADGDVWWFPAGFEPWAGSQFVRLAESLDAFITHYLFGVGYAEVVADGEHDRWYTFRQAHRAG